MTYIMKIELCPRLIADTEDELHAFAQAIGLARHLCQYRDGKAWYSLLPIKKQMAETRGAVEIEEVH